MSQVHTAGPWRWEINRKSKLLQLVGGVPKYDLTVMDFERWGMHGAVVRLREDVAHMNIMHRLCDRNDWIAPFEGRNHHAEWCADVTHPDMRLMAAAPDLLAALRTMVEQFTKTPSTLADSEARIKAHEAIAKATGDKT